MPAKNSVKDGYVSYAGGVEFSSDNHRGMRVDQIRMSTNGTVRSGFFEPRPGIREIESYFTNVECQPYFNRGHVQGYSYYAKAEIAVFAIDGHIFGYDPSSHIVTCLNPVDGRPALSRKADQVWMQEHAGFMVIQDGINTPVILEGLSSRYRQANEVPIGTAMASGWGRLAVVSNGRQIRFSDHEFNINSEPLKFDNEANSYYISAPYFEAPSKGGDVVALKFLPFLDADTGIGPLLAFQKHSTQYYNVGVDRAQWSTQDISGTSLPNIGAAGPYGFTTSDTSLLWIDDKARLRSFRNAREEEQTLNARPFDHSVYKLYDTEAPDLVKYRQLFEFDRRIFSTIRPMSEPHTDPEVLMHRVRHQGMVVRELELAAPYTGSNESVWAGLWTGIHPCGVVVGEFAGEERCIILAQEEDGKNKFYELTKGRCYDETLQAAYKIRSQLHTREFDFGETAERKAISEGSLFVNSGTEGTKIRAEFRDEDTSGCNWFSDESDVSSEMRCADDCYFFPATGNRKPLFLGEPTSDCGFYKGSVKLDIEGRITIEELTIDVTRKPEKKGANYNPDLGTSARKFSKESDDSEFYEYFMERANPVTLQGKLFEAAPEEINNCC